MKRSMLIGLNWEIGVGARIVGPVFCTASRVKIGSNTFIGRDLTIDGNGEVVIGDNCDLGPHISLETGGHIIADSSRRAGKGVITRISIGNGTWIGANTTVINNTAIGKGCVVAACSCVTADTEDDVLVGGVPAKVIRKL